MTRRGQAEFQVHMKTDSGFQTNVLDDDVNLWVVDVYSGWCGNCTCATGSFQKLNIKYNDESIKFGTAETDSIEYLKRYCGNSKPTFMWFAGKGTLLDIVRGVDVPLIIQKTEELLEKEKKIKAGDIKREAFIDTHVMTPKLEEEVENEDKEEEEGEEDRVITVAVIKPDAVTSGKVEDILAKLDEVGIEVLSKVERTLNQEEAESFYEEHRGTDFFLQLIDYMTSGPIVALALVAKDAKKDVVEQWRLLIGPKDVTIAKQEAPESLRAQFASSEEPYKNALHGSDSAEQAARELAFFFPSFHKQKKGKSEPVKVQRTLALIRPDALRKYKDEILEKVKAAGFEVANAKEVSLTKEQAAVFYKEHEGQEYFEKLINHMSSGPVLALALCREEAITGWRDLLGPKNVEEAKDIAPESLRAQFIESEDDPALNALHGSDSLESAEREVNFFFPKQQTLAMVKPDASAEDRDIIMDKIRQSGFHIAAQKETVLTQELVQQFYKEHAEKEFFGDLTDFMTSGPTMFMLLSREDAISGMREIVGPTDPEEAKQTAPDSIRAHIGTDKMKNAIHAPTDEGKAKEAIMVAFGDTLDFDEDGKAIIEEQGGQKTPDDDEIEGTAHGKEEETSAEAVTDAKEADVTGEIQEAKQAEAESKPEVSESGPLDAVQKSEIESISEKTEPIPAAETELKSEAINPESKPGSAKSDSKPEAGDSESKTETAESESKSNEAQSESKPEATETESKPEISESESKPENVDVPNPGAK